MIVQGKLESSPIMVSNQGLNALGCWLRASISRTWLDLVVVSLEGWSSEWGSSHVFIQDVWMRSWTRVFIVPDDAV